MDWAHHQLTLFDFVCSDRFRTTSNVLDDCFAAAIIEKLSEKELEDDIEMTEQQSIDL